MHKVLKISSVLQLFCLLFLGNIQPTHAQLSADSLLQEIAKLQVVETDFYFKGQFKSQRFQKGRWLEDNNIFYSASIAYTLQNYQSYFDINSQIEIDNIIHNIAINYPAFCAKENLFTCNFWIPQNGYQFPGSPKMSRNRKYMLPDDMDDTALLLLTGNFDFLEKARAAEFLALFTSSKPGINKKGVPKQVKNELFYSTWFGKKMPLEFDIVVQCNVLLFKARNGLTFNAVDSSIVSLLEHFLQSGSLMKKPEKYSTQYLDKHIIYYHIARLIQAEPELNTTLIKQLLERDLAQLYSMSEERSWNRFLTANALLMIGKKCAPIDKRPKGDLHFFYANLVSTMPRWIQVTLSPFKQLKMPYRGEAFELALLLEHAVLQQKVSSQ